MAALDNDIGIYIHLHISSNVGTLTGGSFKTSIRLVSLTRIA